MRVVTINAGIVTGVFEINRPIADFPNVGYVEASEAVVGWLYDGVTFTAHTGYLGEMKFVKLSSLIKSSTAARFADVTVAGKVYSGSSDYQFTILTLLSRQSRNKPIPTTIRGVDGIPVTLTFALLGLIEDALYDQGKAASDNLAAKVAAVNASTTVAQVEAVVW